MLAQGLIRGKSHSFELYSMTRVFRRSKEARFKIQPDDPVDPSIGFTVSGY